jgi:hypothetical protein
MKTKHIIIGLIIVLVVLFFVQKKEHAGSTPPNLSNEAIQNIAKVYADTNNTAVFNNIKTTGEATIPTIKGATTVDGAITLKGATTADGPTTLKGATTVDGPITLKGATTVDGHATFNTRTNFKGVAGIGQTHFPYDNGENYIRGTTHIDGHVNFNNGITYRGHPLVECTWHGERRVWGDGGGCKDDLWLTCYNGKLAKIRFDC